jgi:hypothetical protein
VATELWLALGAGVLLVLSAAVQALALSKGPDRIPWTAVATVARVGAALLLVAALVTSGIAAGEWLPFDGARVALSLALTTLVIDLLLAWRLGVDGGGLVLDLIGIALILLAATAFHPSGAPLTYAQRIIPFRIEWLLLLLGAGAALVAGSSGLMLAFLAVLERLRWGARARDRAKVHVFLKQSTLLSLVLLGAGLTLGVWWAWRTGALLIGLDPRSGWLAVTWLVAAASLLAWQLGRRASRWATALAVLAGAIVLFGLLVAPELVRVLWA